MPSGHRPPIPPGIARVAISGTLFTHAWTNVFYLNLGGTLSSITAADLTSVCTEIANLWNTNIAPAVVSACVLTEVGIVFVPSVGNEIQVAQNFSHAGTNAGTALQDASASYVINWSINAYYRGGHPRLYQPGVSAAQITNGSDVLTSFTIAASWLAVMNALDAYTTTNISSIQMGTVSFATGNAWRGTPLFRKYLSATQRPKLGSQRRRILS
jgi:hypothetical protein